MCVISDTDAQRPPECSGLSIGLWNADSSIPGFGLVGKPRASTLVSAPERQLVRSGVRSPQSGICRLSIAEAKVSCIYCCIYALGVASRSARHGRTLKAEEAVVEPIETCCIRSKALHDMLRGGNTPDAGPEPLEARLRWCG